MILISVLSLAFDTHQRFRVQVDEKQDGLEEPNQTCDSVVLNSSKVIFLFCCHIYILAIRSGWSDKN